MKTLRSLLPSILLAALILGLSHVHFAANLHERRLTTQAGLETLCMQRVRGLEDSLTQLSTAPGILAGLIRSGAQDMSAFEATADAVGKAFPVVEALGLAPDGVIASVYPKRGHIQALGKDLLDAPEWAMDNSSSAEPRNVLMAGPFRLMDGRTGFSSRVPVFLGQAGEERIWGFVTAVTSLDRLVRAGGLEELSRQGMSYRLESATGQLLFGDSSQGTLSGADPDRSPAVSLPVKVPGVTLFLQVRSAGPPLTLESYWLGYGMAISVALIASVLLHVFLRSPQLLRQLVAERTAKLRLVNRRLAGEIRRGRQAAWDLETSLELSRGLFEDSPAVKLLVDPDSLSLVDVNPAASRFYGWSREDMAGMPLESINTSGGEKIAQDVSQAMTGEFSPFRAVHRLASGGLRDVEIYSGPVHQGGKVLLQSVIQDVSEREASRRELRRSQERLEAIVNSANWGIAELDGEGRVLFVNQPMGPLFGMAPDDFLGKPYLDFLHPDEREAAAKLSLKVAEASFGRFCMQARCVRTDGTTFWGNVSVGPVRDASGGITGTVSVITDVTELLEAKRAAEEASRAKSRFLANVSHEIRSPMNAIMGLTELTLRTHLDTRQRDNLEKVLTASRALLKIIESILDYSRLETGRLELVNAPFRVGDLVEGLRERFARQAGGKGLELRVQAVGDASGFVLGDGVRLEQVLGNLLENALAFTQNGHVELAVAARIIRKSGADLVAYDFRVTDTGIGMYPEFLGKLFQPFSQADAELTRAVGGAGLGLSIARRLVEAMGGRIEAESVQGRGSSFSFSVEFPRIDERDLDSDALSSLESMDEMVQGLDGMRVLVVDDNELGRFTALETLRQAGLDASGAESGPVALAILAEKSFDAVLLDIQMPGMDGFETFKAIRQIPGRRELPVIALTGHATREDRLRSLEAGMDDHLGKPLDSSSLFAALRQYRPDRAVRNDAPAGAVLDTARALALLMGNQDLYGRLLAGFTREYASAASSLGELLGTGKTEEAVMLVHSVKGLAANLGGDLLTEAAKRLEISLQEADAARREADLNAFVAALEDFTAQAGDEARRLDGKV